MELMFADEVNVDCLCSNQGSWHKSCHLKLGSSLVEKDPLANDH